MTKSQKRFLPGGENLLGGLCGSQHDSLNVFVNIQGGKVAATLTTSLGAGRPPLSLKRIRPGWIMVTQDTPVKFSCQESTIRELESHFVVERPFVPSLRVDSQQNPAVRDFSFRWAALGS